MKEDQSFEEQLFSQFQEKILKEVKGLNLLHFDYKNRVRFDETKMEQFWEALDWDHIILLVRKDMEVRIANAIVGNMQTEVKTDIKKLMAISGVREKLRIQVYPKLMAILNEVDK